MCEFDATLCTSVCAKFSMCSFHAIQNQLNSVQNQINFLLKTITEIFKENEKLALNMEDIVKTLVQLQTESEKIKSIGKDSANEEEIK